MLPLDIFELIIFYSNIEDISNLCLTNKDIHNLCLNKHTWVKKFSYTQMKMITTNNWIKEYKKVKYAEFYSNNLLKLMTEEYVVLNKNVELYFDYEKEMINLLPATFKMLDGEEFICIEMNANSFTISHFYYNNINNSNNRHIENLNKPMLQKLLFNLIYNFPDIIIEDENEKSYLDINLSDEIDEHVKYRNNFWKKE
jgi:hypothetical protein